MKSEVTGAAEYLAEVAALAARLQERGLSVFEIQYSDLSFGSWTLLAGTSKRRVQLSWNGREGELTAQSAAFADSRSRPEWDALSLERFEDSSPATLLRAAEQVILRASEVPAA